MLVSVLMPTLDRAKYLKEALESARQQSYRELEILVSDDGSRDGTPEYVAAVAREDSRVRLIVDNATPGIFSNMNHLVSKARGQAVCLLGDDDRLDQSYVESLIEPLLSDPTIVASFCDHRIIDANGTTLSDESATSSRIWGRASLPNGIVSDAVGVALHQTMCLGFSMYRKQAFAGGLFDLRCGGAADVDFAIRVAQSGRLYYVASVLGDYRVHPGTATTTKARYMAEGAIEALRKHQFQGPEHERLRLNLLRHHLLSHALLLSTTERGAALRSALGFLRTGGSPLAPRFVAATALCLLPRPLAKSARGLARALKRAAPSHRG